MLPNFLIIGAPRSGTTWLDENLRTHPEVFMPVRKELHFFDQEYDKGIEHYEQYFAKAHGYKAVGEATPDYLHGLYTKNDVPALIHRHIPGAKLVVSLRNPVERAYSRFMNAKAKYDHNAGLSFEEKLRSVKGKADLIREGFYADQLKRFYALFPAENILVMLYDDLVADPRGFLRTVYGFLGVDRRFVSRVAEARINMAAGKRNLARSKAVWYFSRALSRANAHRLSERVRRWNAVPQPQMSPETRRMLVEIYRERNLELQALIGRDLSHWNRLPESESPEPAPPSAGVREYPKTHPHPTMETVTDRPSRER